MVFMHFFTNGPGRMRILHNTAIFEKLAHDMQRAPETQK